MNWNMLGHGWAVELLQEHVSKERLRHAYLITGPPGVGKRTLALRLAQAINCLQPPAPGDRCGICRSCTLIERMEHPDLMVVQADNVGGVLKVDAVRQLQRSLSLSPYEARYRVALFLRFEEAHLSAANALLKTLEEPADRVVLILTAETADELFPTIVSRCEVFRLRPLPLDQLADGLQSTLNLDENQAALLAHISNGCPGTAIRLASDKEMIKFRQECIQDFQQLMVSDLVARFTVADSLSKEKERLRAILSTWLSVCRDILLHAAGAALPLQNPDMRDWVGQMANEVGLQQAQKSVTAIQRTQMLLNRNANARLALEVLMLSLPGL